MANPRLLQTLSHGQCAAAAIMILAPAASIKAPLQAQGLRPHHMPLREIALAADAYLAEHRAEVLAEAKGNR